LIVQASLEAAGGVVEVLCPACKALVDLGEALADTLLVNPSTEAQQVAAGEQAILYADSATLAALQATHVTFAPSPVVSAVGAVVAPLVPVVAGAK
jgi:anti-sigma factor ChrR (cupin superfamily)